MPRAQRTKRTKQKPIHPPEDSESPLSDISGEIAKSKTLESHEAHEIATKKKRTVNIIVKSKPKGRKRKARSDDSDIDNKKPTTPKKPRDSTRKKTAEILPLAIRAVGMKMLVGAHVSMAKGVQNAVINCNRIGGNAFALFLKSQKKWTSHDLEESDAVAFRDNCIKSQFDPKRSQNLLPASSVQSSLDYLLAVSSRAKRIGAPGQTDPLIRWAETNARNETAIVTVVLKWYLKPGFPAATILHILPHGSYLINLAQSDEDKAKQAYNCFVDDLKRCEILGIGMYNFHPGSTLGLPRPEALARIAAHLNRAHKETKFVKTVLENMAGQGNIIGANFEDLRDIINQVKDKDRVGVCLDTCHLFAAGHDIRTQASYDTVMANFDRIVGQKYLMALHLNDSKAPLGANRDLHQNIGVGFLGLESFRVLMNDKRLEGLPMVLETPMKVEKTWVDEIKLLESLVGTPADDPDFLTKAAELATIGQGERKAAEMAAEKKRTAKKAPRAKKESKKRLKGSDSEDEGGHVSQH